MNISFITRFFRWMGTNRFKRFELLLPTKYNDGTAIELEKFNQTARELTDRLSGLTQDLVHAQGIFGGNIYYDKLLRLRIDSVDPDATTFMKSFKKTLKQRFQQLDIWITAHEIEII